MNLLHILFYLIAAHALFDFPLQGEAVAINKNRNLKTELQKHVPWFYWMGAHSLCHGLAVAVITNCVWFGLAETIAHFVIDFGKCEQKYSIHIDQALHILCKIVWVLIIIIQ